MSEVKLMQGDCLERMKQITDGSIDMVLTDPPYGTTACKWDTVIDLPSMWDQLKRTVKPNGAIVMTAGQPFTSALVMSNPSMLSCQWVWEKEQGVNFMLAKKQPMKVHEDVLVFAKKQPTYNPQMTVGKPYTSGKGDSGEVTGKVKKVQTINSGTRYPRSILAIKRETGHHPTQKPVALMEYMIKTYTNEGEAVLDFTMGSGTTGVACVKTNRNFIGIELDSEYFNIAQSRIQETKERLV